ncbi:hypothetical protein P3X46_007116 [Hevea brasiliensis]|uniref:Protein RALF-like 32 n=1 Tax=Hevea brasiliensis TaxID=3981 RepID=A0ABQ9MTF6_HEVBR|nr:protein RALF-like 32 [Hevea brasiliensis]KAJ9183228.1 hypothetical protein P3X46_007116 [Hevea brasiliensis]
MEQKKSFFQFCFLAIILISLSYLCKNKVSASSSCNGSIIGECNEEYELLMESEISRRFLEQEKSISYKALDRDKQACSGDKGQSYSSSCLPPPSNPPSRGCSKRYRCRS